MKELKAHRIKRQIKELYVELEKHQDRCKHSKLEKECGSDTGNYDPYDDCFWTDFYCPTCLKQWREEVPAY